MTTRQKLLKKGLEIGARIKINRECVSIELPKYIVSLRGDGMHFRDFYIEGFPVSITYGDALDWLSSLGECPDKGHCEICDEVRKVSHT